MAFIQQHRPNSARQLSHHAPEPAADVASSSQQLKRPLEQSEEWVLFSPTAPSTTARTETTSTERTPRTAGLSRFSEFGSLDTAARSEQEDDEDTEEDLDSLDEGLHAFHEPSEHGTPVVRLQSNGDSVLPTHDGMGEFQPDAALHEHMWEFERPRRRVTRRRSSVQRHFGVLDDVEHVTTEQDRRLRIEKWRLEQSKALLEEIEKETRRRRRMSTSSAARNRVDTAQQDSTHAAAKGAPSVTSTHSDSSEEGIANLSFWKRITRSVICDLIGLDENTLAVIFGEALPDDTTQSEARLPAELFTDKAFQEAGIDTSRLSDNWQTKLLERVAQELGTLVHQLSEHPGAFSTYQNSISEIDYAGLTKPIPSTTVPSKTASSHLSTSAQNPASSPASAQFAPTFPLQTSHLYSEASLWGIEEEPELLDPENATNGALPPETTSTSAEELAREREYWERELDVKMIFNFLVQRFSSRQTSVSPPQSRRPSTTSPVAASSSDTRNAATSARRAAIIRQNHPLVSRTADRTLPTSSASLSRENKTYRAYFIPQPALRHSHHHHHHHHHHPQKLKSNSSCASQSTKKSKRSNSSSRNYWDLGGSVGSVAGGA